MVDFYYFEMSILFPTLCVIEKVDFGMVESTGILLYMHHILSM